MDLWEGSRESSIFEVGINFLVLKRLLRVVFLSISACCLLPVFSFSQNLQIILGPDEIGDNQAWTISVTANNETLKSYDNFPDIDGFRKRGTSTQSQTSIINGSVSSTQSVVMTYSPLQQGTFTVPAFKMKVNGVALSSQAKTVKVGPAIQAQYNDPSNRPSAFGRGETEFVDIKEDALLALTTNK